MKRKPITPIEVIRRVHELGQQRKPDTSEVCQRITEYLSLGGLFNPEMMEHDKVRDLLIDCRASLALEVGRVYGLSMMIRDIIAIYVPEAAQQGLLIGLDHILTMQPAEPKNGG